MERDPVIGLTASEARSAKLAYRKESRKSGDGRNQDIIEELGRAFDGENMGTTEIMRFRIPSDHAEDFYHKIEDHASYRKKKGETSSGKKYQSIASKVRSQLSKQGVILR